MSTRMELIRQRLQSALPDARIELVDEGHLHVGHAGARDGRGHFRLHIVSEAFVGKNALARHRLIYAALAELMDTEIHALAIVARAPEEMP